MLNFKTRPQLIRMESGRQNTAFRSDERVLTTNLLTFTRGVLAVSELDSFIDSKRALSLKFIKKK